jgi:hypothetical protein
MIALTVLLSRIFLIFLIVKIVWSVFFKPANTKKESKYKKNNSVKRYKVDGKIIDDADFEDIK